MNRLQKVSLLIIFFIITHFSITKDTAYTADTGDYVVLLHGLGRTALSMKKLERILNSSGFTAVNVSHPSTKYRIESLANIHLSKAIIRRCTDPTRKIHFVTHSMGGIIVRYYLKKNRLLNLGRVVMLSPPNKGSQIATRFRNNVLFKIFMGPAGQQLGIHPKSLPNTLGSADFELGIIAGDKSLNPYFSKLIPGADDGTISVEHTKLEGMKDFIIMHKDHLFIMQNEEVIEQVIYFLEHGRFFRK